MDDRFDMPSADLTQPPLDPEALAHILNLGGAEMRVALQAQLISDFARLRAALDDDDAARLQRAAHELKGLAATIGAQQVLKLAETLDEVAKGQQPGACSAMIAPLQHQVDRVIAALRETPAA